MLPGVNVVRFSGELRGKVCGLLGGVGADIVLYGLRRLNGFEIIFLHTGLSQF